VLFKLAFIALYLWPHGEIVLWWSTWVELANTSRV